MPTLSFEGETHAEIVAKVKRWLGSLDGEEKPLSPAEAVQASAELTKEALRIVASAAPDPIARSDLVKGLTSMGYAVTDSASKALVDTLDSLAQVTGGSLVENVQDAGAGALFEMNSQVAKQVLKALRNRNK
jgi:hypothetical protein